MWKRTLLSRRRPFSVIMKTDESFAALIAPSSPTLERLWPGSEWRQLLRVILVKSCRNQWAVGIAATLSILSIIYYLEWCLLTGAWHCWGHWYDVQWSGTLWVVSVGRPHTTPSDGVTWRGRGCQGTRTQHEEPPCCLHSQYFGGYNDGGCFL